MCDRRCRGGFIGRRSAIAVWQVGCRPAVLDSGLRRNDGRLRGHRAAQTDLASYRRRPVPSIDATEFSVRSALHRAGFIGLRPAVAEWQVEYRPAVLKFGLRRNDGRAAKMDLPSYQRRPVPSFVAWANEGIPTSWWSKIVGLRGALPKLPDGVRSMDKEATPRRAGFTRPLAVPRAWRVETRPTVQRADMAFIVFGRRQKASG